MNSSPTAKSGLVPSTPILVALVTPSISLSATWARPVAKASTSLMATLSLSVSTLYLIPLTPKLVLP